MKPTKLSGVRTGFVACSLLAVALAGCRTDVVHERTVYLPAPPPPVVEVPPAPPPQPPPVVVAPSPEPPAVVIIRSENDFYEPLAPYGRWEVVGSYGRCWIPARVEPDWRPYANGYWQRTDAGWYWVSEEPWGWATYHYGRWDFQPRFGWIWIPQTQWAPAWVAWREGAGYVGWSPLRPSVSLNLRIGTAVREPRFEPRDFVFVERRRMLEPVRPKTVIVNNTTIINKTVNITNVKVVNNTVINEGPRADVVERESGRKVQAVPVREVRHREETAVAARERNIPTAPERRVQPPARTPTQPTPKQPGPGNVNVVEKATEPATQPSQQPRSPFQNREAVRPQPTERRVVTPRTAPEPVTTNPVGEAVKQPPDRTPPGAAPVQPATGRPAREERGREVENARTVKPVPPGIERKAKNEARPEPNRERKPPVRPETAPPTVVKKQIAPPTKKPDDKRLLSPKERSRASEQGEANKKKKEDKGPKKKGEDQEEATPPANSPRQPQ